jgi:hypothetical protein
MPPLKSLPNLSFPRSNRGTIDKDTMQKHTIKRDGDRPIVFTGELIGKGDNQVGSDGNRANRWTEVAIYRTKGRRYVAELTRHTCWQGESDRRSAGSFATAGELIEWLKEGEDSLGSVSQEAVEDAAKNDDGFAAEWVEEVE